MAVTDATMTQTTHAVFIPDVWADGTLDAVQFAEVIANRVTREYEGDIRNMGDTVRIQRTSNFQTQTKLTGISNTILFEAITETEATLPINIHEYAAFLIENVLEVQANTNLRAKYERKVGYALARGREVQLANLFQSYTQVVGTYGVELTPDDYLSAWQKLAEAGLLEASPDPGNEFSIIMSPASYAAALKTDVFINKLYNGAARAVEKAQIGEIYGCTAFLSNLLRVPSAGQHDNIMLHRSALALAVQEEVPVRSDWLIRNLGDGVVGWNLYGHTRLLYPPETPGGGAAVDNRAVLLRSV